MKSSQSWSKTPKKGRFVDRIFKEMEGKQKEDIELQMTKKNNEKADDQSQISRTLEGNEKGEKL